MSVVVRACGVAADRASGPDPVSIIRNPLPMPNERPTDGSSASTTARKTRRTLVAEAFLTTCGEPVRLTELYALVENRAEARARSSSTHHVRAKVRQQCQLLRRLGLVEMVAPGVWRLVMEPAPGCEP